MRWRPGGCARRPRWLGERELDPSRYDQEFPCDWTTGSFMLVRREALESAGWFDERFFMYAEETDLCRRVKTAGWEIWHLPQMTILHRGVTKDGVKPHVESLYAVTRMMYARKHFSPGHRALYRGAVLLRHLLRVGYAGTGELGAAETRGKPCRGRDIARAPAGAVRGDHEPGLGEHRRLGAARGVGGSAGGGRRRYRALTPIKRQLRCCASRRAWSGLGGECVAVRRARAEHGQPS